jgi:hypothetical protein
MGHNIGIRAFVATAAILVLTGLGASLAQAQEGDNLLLAPGDEPDDSQTTGDIAADEPITQGRNPNTGQLLPSLIVQQQVDAQGGSRVPILVPYIWTFSSRAAKTNRFKIKAETANYTAIFRPPSIPGAMPGAIDVVIDGSIDFIQSEKRALRRTTEPYPFDSLGEVRGGSISFRKFGASYLVQFYCRDELELEAPSCITADVARKFVLRELLGEVQ